MGWFHTTVSIRPVLVLQSVQSVLSFHPPANITVFRAFIPYGDPRTSAHAAYGDPSPYLLSQVVRGTRHVAPFITDEKTASPADPPSYATLGT